MSTNDYTQALCVVTASLGLKLMINKILVARARVGSSSLLWKEDKTAAAGWMGPVFKYGLLAVGPLTSKDDLDRLSGLENNSAQNEPLILATALAYGCMFPSPPAYAATLILAAGKFRFISGGCVDDDDHEALSDICMLKYFVVCDDNF
jgi:hypothetical protein